MYFNVVVVFDVVIVIKCFGVGVLYMIIIGDLMFGVVEVFGSVDSGLFFFVDWKFWIIVFFLVFIILFSFFKKLDLFKYISIVVLFLIGYLVILVVYYFGVDEVLNNWDICWVIWEGLIVVLRSLLVMIFVYICYQNVCFFIRMWLFDFMFNVVQMFFIVNEIKDNFFVSIVGVIGFSIGFVVFIYVLVVIIGYFIFGNEVKGNIVSMYLFLIVFIIVKVVIVIFVIFSIFF